MSYFGHFRVVNCNETRFLSFALHKRVLIILDAYNDLGFHNMDLIMKNLGRVLRRKGNQSFDPIHHY